MESRGIDVSEFQGNINWQDVANSNIDFAIIRASYGQNGLDNQFKNNMSEISNTQIYPGAYHYTYAQSTSDAIKEANHFLNTIKPYKFYYPVALDIEEASIGALGKQTVADIINAFCNTLKDSKYLPIVYTNLNWLQTYIDTSLIPNLDIWLAEWGPQLTYKDNVTIWQYTSQGSVPGINGNVDMNISFKDYPTIIRNQGLNNTNVDDNSGGSVPNPPATVIVRYTVKSGDTLWSIAKRFLGNGNRYREIMLQNGLTNDTIYPGQVLNISVSSNEGPINYIVRSGDTLWDIAQRYLGDGNRYKEIMQANGLTSDRIYPGQILKIPTNSSNIQTTYTVKSGDNLWTIAQRLLGDGNRYREIMSLNNLSSETIQPGQVLLIP